jgi:hypothetical protein
MSSAETKATPAASNIRLSAIANPGGNLTNLLTGKHGGIVSGGSLSARIDGRIDPCATSSASGSCISFPAAAAAETQHDCGNLYAQKLAVLCDRIQGVVALKLSNDLASASVMKPIPARARREARGVAILFRRKMVNRLDLIHAVRETAQK